LLNVSVPPPPLKGLSSLKNKSGRSVTGAYTGRVIQNCGSVDAESNPSLTLVAD
jgi:hypothetical protein